jgi:hypothetical protein
MTGIDVSEVRMKLAEVLRALDASGDAGPPAPAEDPRVYEPRGKEITVWEHRSGWFSFSVMPGFKRRLRFRVSTGWRLDQIADYGVVLAHTNGQEISAEEAALRVHYEGDPRRRDVETFEFVSEITKWGQDR